MVQAIQGNNYVSGLTLNKTEAQKQKLKEVFPGL